MIKLQNVCLIPLFTFSFALLVVAQFPFFGHPQVQLRWICRQIDNLNGTNTSITEHANGTRVISHEKVTNGTLCFPSMVPMVVDTTMTPMVVDTTAMTQIDDSTKNQDHVRRKRQFKPKVRLQKAVAFITAYKLEKCSARIVCELSCNPDSLGPDGRNLYDTLLHLFVTGNLPGVTAEQIAFYTEARQKGLANKATTCKNCYQQYRECMRRSASLIRMVAGVQIVP